MEIDDFGIFVKAQSMQVFPFVVDDSSFHALYKFLDTNYFSIADFFLFFKSILKSPQINIYLN